MVHQPTVQRAQKGIWRQ